MEKHVCQYCLTDEEGNHYPNRGWKVDKNGVHYKERVIVNRTRKTRRTQKIILDELCIPCSLRASAHGIF